MAAAVTLLVMWRVVVYVQWVSNISHICFDFNDSFKVIFASGNPETVTNMIRRRFNLYTVDSWARMTQQLQKHGKVKREKDYEVLLQQKEQLDHIEVSLSRQKIF